MPTIYNKVELDGTTLLDLSQDTASSASHIRQGYTAHLNDGTQVTGSYSGSTPTIQSLTVNPSTTQQTFNASGVDGYKPVTVSAVSQTNLTAGNIKNGTTVTISNGTSNIYSVTGTYSGGGSSKNAQTAQSTTRSTSTTYTECISLTCTKSGTYNVYWSTFRSSTSGTWGSQLYINDTAYGTAQTGSWSNHIQNIHLTGVSITANQEVSVRVRTRGNGYYGYVGTLTIIEA